MKRLLKRKTNISAGVVVWGRLDKDGPSVVKPSLPEKSFFRICESAILALAQVRVTKSAYGTRPMFVLLPGRN